MEQALPWITVGVQIVAFILLYVHQKNIIKSQKSAIESMQAYHQLFDIDKLKSYVSLTAETQRLELEKQHKREVEEMKNALEKSKADTDKVGELLLYRQDVEHKLRWELMNGAIGLIYEQPRDKRIEFTKKLFPLNSETLLAMIEDISKKVPTL